MQIYSVFAQTKTSKEQQIKGDLYFKLIRPGNMYHADSASILKMNKLLDTMRIVRAKSSIKIDNPFLDFYDLLEQNNLTKKPSFEIRTASGQILMVLVDENEFEKVKDYKWSELNKEGKKVAVDLTGKSLTLGTTTIIDCTKITRVDKINRKTYWKK